MKTCIIFLLFSCSLTMSRAQSIETRELTISHSFDNLTLQSYAVQGELKVQELVEYLRLLSIETNPPELDRQLISNIEQLFLKQSPQLSGIESHQVFLTPSKWVEEWEKMNVNIVSVTLLDSELKNTFWSYTYQLIYKINGREKKKKMSVRVNFQPQTKTFGNTEKEVWELKIGSIEFN